LVKQNIFLKPLTSHRRLGRSAENLALWFLRQRGWFLLCRNWHSRYGELDCVVQHLASNTIAFVEVKALRRETHHRVEEAVSYAKQQKMAKCANLWRLQHGIWEAYYRFDVIGIVMQSRKMPRIRYIPNAFSSDHFLY